MNSWISIKKNLSENEKYMFATGHIENLSYVKLMEDVEIIEKIFGEKFFNPSDDYKMIRARLNFLAEIKLKTAEANDGPSELHWSIAVIHNCADLIRNVSEINGIKKLFSIIPTNEGCFSQLVATVYFHKFIKVEEVERRLGVKAQNRQADIVINISSVEINIHVSTLNQINKINYQWALYSLVSSFVFNKQKENGILAEKMVGVKNIDGYISQINKEKIENKVLEHGISPGIMKFEFGNEIAEIELSYTDNGSIWGKLFGVDCFYNSDYHLKIINNTSALTADDCLNVAFLCNQFASEIDILPANIDISLYPRIDAVVFFSYPLGEKRFLIQRSKMFFQEDITNEKKKNLLVLDSQLPKTTSL